MGPGQSAHAAPGLGFPAAARRRRLPSRPIGTRASHADAALPNERDTLRIAPSCVRAAAQMRSPGSITLVARGCHDLSRRSVFYSRPGPCRTGYWGVWNANEKDKLHASSIVLRRDEGRTVYRLCVILAASVTAAGRIFAQTAPGMLYGVSRRCRSARSTPKLLGTGVAIGCDSCHSAEPECWDPHAAHGAVERRARIDARWPAGLDRSPRTSRQLAYRQGVQPTKI